jgi:hypothetical protein
MASEPGSPATASFAVDGVGEPESPATAAFAFAGVTFSPAMIVPDTLILNLH